MKTIKKKKGIQAFVIESIAIFAVVIAVICVLDSRRVFSQEENNNHTGRRWNALYAMKGKNNAADILVLGNSHAYCGLLPEVVEEITGLSCFILASQGNFVTDSYYMLEEALTLVKPKILVVETYLMRDYVQKEMTDGNLNCQFQSFENRRNFCLKLKSTPVLFSADNAPYAWSKTLRNHSYLFEKPDLVKFNLKHPESQLPKEKNYKGRFICFQNGLTDPVLERYKKEGPPVNGASMVVGEQARLYCRKIISLCQKNGIRVVFLTIPMYKEHISNVQTYHSNLSEAIGSSPWLDLQQSEFNQYFNENCFEDTYKQNQHQTSTGAYISSQILSQWLIQTFRKQ